MNRIEVRDISVSFVQNKQEIKAVDQVSFEVAAGEIFGIVGLSGAGKSTLIRTLNLLQRPTSGQLLIDGQDITNYKGQALKAVRKKIGMIFQHFNLIQNRTIGQNIAFALKAAGYPKEAREQRIDELLALVDLSEKKDSYPGNLSGGQKQRVGIARALANDPEILLCDEATSALDVETTEEILKILAEINQQLGLTIVFITHELEVAKRLFDRIAVMENGRIIELNETFELFANPQADITQRLVGRYLNVGIPEELADSLTDGCLLELKYHGQDAIEPLISQISKRYDVLISITHGKIEYVHNQAIGILVVHLTGREEHVKAAIREIRKSVTELTYLKGAKHYGDNLRYLANASA